MVASIPADWGEWLLDDLAFVAKTVSRLLGPSEDVTRLIVVKPDGSLLSTKPLVVLMVRAPRIAERMRDRVLHGEYVVDVYDPLFGDSWQAEVNGIAIRIETETA